MTGTQPTALQALVMLSGVNLRPMTAEDYLDYLDTAPGSFIGEDENYTYLVRTDTEEGTVKTYLILTLTKAEQEKCLDFGPDFSYSIAVATD